MLVKKSVKAKAVPSIILGIFIVFIDNEHLFYSCNILLACSLFLGHTRAQDLLKKFKCGMGKLNSQICYKYLWIV
jgi:hypothetical protein